MTAMDAVLDAFAQQDWVLAGAERVSGGRGANPTRVDIVLGRRQRLALMLYAWKITGEGKGRSGDNFRIQTTRSHADELLSEPNRLTLGIGLDLERQVLAVFDGWTKRNTGRSSSVHIKRSLLDVAASDGFSTDGPAWDSRAACRVQDANSLLPWIQSQSNTRLAAVQPLSHEVLGEQATATADLWDSAPAAWLRIGDQLVLANRAGDQLVDNSIWKVKDLAVAVTTPGRNPRRQLTFTLRRLGRVHNPAELLEGLTRRPAI